MSRMNRRKYTDSCESYLRCVECSALYVVDPEELEGAPRVVGCSTCLHEWYATEEDLLWDEDEVLEALGRKVGVKPNGKAINERVAKVVEEKGDGGGIVIFVGNLSYRATDADLYRAFSGYGVVVKCQVPSYMSGASKGYGFVEMRSREGGMRAIAELQGTSIMGRDISLNEANTRKESKRIEATMGRRQRKFDRTREIAQGEVKAKKRERENEKDESNDVEEEIVVDQSEGRRITNEGAVDTVEGTQSILDNAKDEREGTEGRKRWTQYRMEEPDSEAESSDWKRVEVRKKDSTEDASEGAQNKFRKAEDRGEGGEQEEGGAQDRKERVERKKENDGGRRANWNRNRESGEGSQRRVVRGELGGKNGRRDLNAWIARRAYTMRRERRQKETSEEHISSKPS